MQSLEPQNNSNKEEIDENSKGFPCQSSQAPAKTNNVEASHGATAAQKPTFLLLNKNGVVKPKKVIKVVVKPQIPACIKALDVSSLLDQFLEYEQYQSSSATVVKGSSVMLTPVSSPSHINKPKFTGLDSGTNKLTVSPTNGLTPPVSPPSENSSSANKTSLTATPSLAKNLSFTITPAKHAHLNTQAMKSKDHKSVIATTSTPAKPVVKSEVTSKKIEPSASAVGSSVGKMAKTSTPNFMVDATKETEHGKGITNRKPDGNGDENKSNNNVVKVKTSTPNFMVDATKERVHGKGITDRKPDGNDDKDNSNNNVVRVLKRDEKDSQIKSDKSTEMPKSSSNENVIQTRKAEVTRSNYPTKPECGSTQTKKLQSSSYRIPKRKPAEVVERKRQISSDDDDENKDDYNDFKRKKYSRDECYWTTSDEENDNNEGHRQRRRRKESKHYTKRKISRDSSSDSDDDDTRQSHRKYERRHEERRVSRSPHQTHRSNSQDDSGDERQRQSHRKHERRQEESRRSHSPHQTHRSNAQDDSDDERRRRHRKHHSRRDEKKAPLKEDSKESNVHLFDIENERKKNFKLDRTIKETSTEKRKIVYIGNIEDSMRKEDIWSKFRQFGPIEKTTVHYRNDGDNYSFVTFVDAASALEAIEHGKTDQDLKHLDICFGGRRKFCGGSYVDFDSTTSCLEEQQEKEGIRKSSHSNGAMDFDSLLQMALKNKKR